MGIPAVAASCSARSSAPPEDVGAARAALNIGDSCTTDAGCTATATNSACWIVDNPSGGTVVKQCHCLPAYTACGNDCVEIGNDSNNCGYCGHACVPGTCAQGLCGGAAPDAGWSAYLGSVDDLSPYDGGTTGGRASFAHEAAQEASLNNDVMFGLVNFGDDLDGGPGGAKWNSTDAGNTKWGADFRSLPVPASTPDASYLQGFDPIAGTSGWSQKEYLGSILANTYIQGLSTPPPPYHCIGVATADAGGFPSWGGNPLTCTNNYNEGWDLPWFSYDAVGSALWVGADSGTTHYVYKRDPCSGPIGGANCAAPFTAVTSHTLGGANRIVANRCMPGAFTALRFGTNHGTVKLMQIMSDHTTRSCTVSTTEAVVPDTECSTNVGDDCSGKEQVCKCGGTFPHNDCTADTSNTCWELNIGPRIALKAETDACYVYLAWDKSHEVVSSPATWRTEARLVRVVVPSGGITDGSTCTPDVDLPSSYTNETFASNIEISKTSKNVFWSFYSNTIDDACIVDFYAYVDTKLDFSTMQLVRLSASSFPIVIPPLAGTPGHYTATTSIGLPGGVGYPTWAEPEQTLATAGVLCQSKYYDLRVHGRTITLY